MLSYIFNNKVKNIFVIIFCLLCIFSNFDVFYEFSLYEKFPPIMYFFSLAARLFVLIYMLTLKREYRVKCMLFPSSFAILFILVIFSIFDSFGVYAFSSLLRVEFLVSVYLNLILSAAYILCFIGSLWNFKKVILLRIGLLICITVQLISPIVSFFLAGGYEYLTSVPEGITPISYSSLAKQLVILLFNVSLFLLTLNKKSEYIDLAPFIQARKAKKDAKLESKYEHDLPQTEIPDGCWRCMGCGKVLSENVVRCECGYKK